jgi:hypothetical protein
VQAANDCQLLGESGLLGKLLEREAILPEREATADFVPRHDTYKVVEPEMLGFVSYAYEWPFSALKAAALFILELQRLALVHGMVLKDAPSANIQFRGKSRC